jgi:hypothetical protein
MIWWHIKQKSIRKKKLKRMAFFGKQAYISNWDWDEDRLILFAGNKYIQVLARTTYG